jgi:type I restriction enzyme S subunit
MTMLAVTFPRAFAVRFKNTRVWSVGSFVRVEWNWPEEYITPLSKVLHRRVEEVDRKQHSIEDLQLVTLHFNGTIEPRDRGSQKDFKGRLFFAYTGDVVYSKIDVRNGAIGVVPPQMHRVAASSEYPIYEVAPDVTLPFYIQLLFRTSYFRRAINSMVSGASGRKRVQPEQIEALRVPLPPLLIQHAILKRWDNAQREIAARQQQLSGLQEQIEADFLADLGLSSSARAALPNVFAVSWKDLSRWGVQPNQLAATGIDITRGKFSVVTGRDCLAEIKHGCSAGPLLKPSTLEVLKISAVTRGEFNAAERKYIHDSQRYRHEFDLKAGDVLLCRTNGTFGLVGMSALVEHDMPNLIFPDKVIRIRCKPDILPAYLWKVLQMPFMRSQIEAAARTAVGNYAIGTEDLWNLDLPLPPLDVQQRLVAKIVAHQAEILKERDSICHLVAAIEQEIEEMILGTRPVPEFEELRKGTA